MQLQFSAHIGWVYSALRLFFLFFHCSFFRIHACLMMKNGPFPSREVLKVNESINQKSNGKWDLWTARPCSLAGVWLLTQPFPAHLRENRDHGAGSTGTKCFQIKIVFPSALPACFVAALHQAGFQTCGNLSPFLSDTPMFSTYVYVVRFLDSVTVVSSFYPACFSALFGWSWL